jgi:hypothetical protein
MNPDIATLLESHRKHMLESAQAHVDPREFERIADAIARDHDRATTKTLLDLYRSGNGQQPIGNAAPLQPVTLASRKVKAGSKAARQRALKAGETRRKNLAAKRQEEIDKESGSQGSPATVGGAV